MQPSVSWLFLQLKWKTTVEHMLRACSHSSHVCAQEFKILNICNICTDKRNPASDQHRFKTTEVSSWTGEQIDGVNTWQSKYFSCTVHKDWVSSKDILKLSMRIQKEHLIIRGNKRSGHSSPMCPVITAAPVETVTNEPFGFNKLGILKVWTHTQARLGVNKTHTFRVKAEHSQPLTQDSLRRNYSV